MKVRVTEAPMIWIILFSNIIFSSLSFCLLNISKIADRHYKQIVNGYNRYKITLRDYNDCAFLDVSMYLASNQFNRKRTVLNLDLHNRGETK